MTERFGSGACGVTQGFAGAEPAAWVTEREVILTIACM